MTVSYWEFIVMMTSSNGNPFHVTGLLSGEFTGHQWIPLTKASDVELWCFLWSAPENLLCKWSRRRWSEMPSHLSRHCNDYCFVPCFQNNLWATHAIPAIKQNLISRIDLFQSTPSRVLWWYSLIWFVARFVLFQSSDEWCLYGNCHQGRIQMLYLVIYNILK